MRLRTVLLVAALGSGLVTLGEAKTTKHTTARPAVSASNAKAAAKARKTAAKQSKARTVKARKVTRTKSKTVRRVKHK